MTLPAVVMTITSGETGSYACLLGHCGSELNRDFVGANIRCPTLTHGALSWSGGAVAAVLRPTSQFL